MAGSQAPSSQTPQTTGGLLYKNIPQRGHTGPSMSDTAPGSADPNSQPPGMNMYMAGANIRPQGSQGQGQMPQQGHTPNFPPSFMNQQIANYRMKPGSQDSRQQSANFQGSGSLTPDKAFPPDGPSLHPAQHMKSAKPSQQHLYQHHQQQRQQQGQHQSMIHNMMDPAFLVPQHDRGADYKLWPTSHLKNSPSALRQTSDGSSGVPGGMPMGMNPNNFNSPGNLQGLWSNAGPSPLEKLLEQQKIRSQVDN